ncbi:probable cytochrome P450 313a4 [Drosophila tropicalis]|uniref:probable cytochrome P450 313a4 n=1 Tax=Drosophila tropicalis TaxID=46794 RepID=UPI0035ABF26B
MWIGPYPFYVLGDPQLVKEVLNSPLSLNKSVHIYDIMSEVLGNGIIVSKNPTWSKRRKLLNPAFKHSVLLSFLPIFNDESGELLKLMDSFVGSGGRNLLRDMEYFALRVAQKTTMGHDKKELNSKKNSLQHSAEVVMQMFSRIFTLALLAMFPEYQEQLFEELQETYPHTGDFDLTYEDTQKSTLLDRILNESLRLIPPVPITARQATEDMTLSNGFEQSIGMISLHLLVISLALVWIYYLWSRRRYYALMLRVPGPKGLGYIGVAEKDILPLTETFFNKYGNACLTWVGPFPYYIMRDPQLIQEVLNSPHCVKKSSLVYSTISNMLGDGLMTSENPKWSTHRKLLNPAFKQNILNRFLTIFNIETKNFLKLMDSYVGTGEKDLLTDLLTLAFRITTQTTIGSQVTGHETYTTNTLMRSIEHIQDLIPKQIVYPWMRNTLVLKLMGLHTPIRDAIAIVNKTVIKMIEDKVIASDDVSKSEEANPVFVVDHVLAQLKNGNFTYENAKSEANIIIAAGYETTGSLIFFTLLLLAMHSEYQERVYEELLEWFPNLDDFDVSYEDIQKLDYLDRVLNETMRVIPPVPGIFRQCTEDIKLSNGALIPKGTHFAICIFHLHRNKDIWGAKASSFDPDNFLSDNVQQRHPYSFIPFVKGIRTCIGMRYGNMLAKVTLVKLLRNYKFTTKFRYEDLGFVVRVAMKLEKAPLLELEKRVK